LSGFVLQEDIASFSLRVTNLNLGFIGFEKNLIKKWVLLRKVVGLTKILKLADI